MRRLVLWASIWPICVVGFVLAWWWVTFRLSDSGSGGVGAVSEPWGVLLFAAIVLFGPPVLIVVVALIVKTLRRRRD